jgi:mono/diheme cytochrome c family protein
MIGKVLTVQRGKAIYEQTCLLYHQADASGVPGMNPPLRKSPYVQGAPARLISIILKGLNDGVKIDGDTYSNPRSAGSGRHGSSETDRKKNQPGPGRAGSLG